MVWGGGEVAAWFGGGWFEVVSMVGRGGRMVGKEEVMVETGWGGVRKRRWIC